MSAKKQTIKRACIDCHFLVEKQDDTEEAGLEPMRWILGLPIIVLKLIRGNQ
jgi:hypothetical protein